MQVIGKFEKSKNFGFVIPIDSKIQGDIFISKAKWGKARNNQYVVAEITQKSKNGKKAEGKIIKVLKNMKEIDADLQTIVSEFDLQYEFSQKVINEAKKVSKQKINSKNRRNLSNKEIFTIDGEDAKDLDDAICVEKNENETYTLGVHIADVSHYVKENSELDKEAITRGTSVYMLDRVIPMLPTELSNGSCSLNQGKDRYAMSIIMTIDSKGNVIDSEIQKTIVNVTKRMSYHEVSAIINRNNSEFIDDLQIFKSKQYVEKTIEENKKYLKHFDRMLELAQIIKQRRKKEGYLSLDIPETKIILNKNGKPLNIEPYENTLANEIIEQFMLTANETIAERFYWLNAPFIYRVHEKPEAEKVQELNKALFNLGYKLKGKKDDIKPKAFSQILDSIKGKEEENVVLNLLLHTLKIAKYEANNKGHFGIASKYYCHFTSPIRRYPDLFIHRIISKYLENEYNVDEETTKKYEEQAVQYAEICSQCEQTATKAEREAESMKKAEYMESHIGEEYDGIVSGVTKYGLFVDLQNTVEGLIRFEKMGDEYFIFNEDKNIIIGEKTGTTYKLGDKVKIRVIEASKKTRKCGFELITKKA